MAMAMGDERAREKEKEEEEEEEEKEEEEEEEEREGRGRRWARRGGGAAGRLTDDQLPPVSLEHGPRHVDSGCVTTSSISCRGGERYAPPTYLHCRVNTSYKQGLTHMVEVKQLALRSRSMAFAQLCHGIAVFLAR